MGHTSGGQPASCSFMVVAVPVLNAFRNLEKREIERKELKKKGGERVRGRGRERERGRGRQEESGTCGFFDIPFEAALAHNHK